jgi:hypothetical protein
VPTIEKIRRHLDASTVFIDRSRQFTDRQIAICVIKQSFNFRIKGHR